MALRSFNSGWAVFGCIFEGQAGPRPEVTSLDGLKPGIVDGEACGGMKVPDKGGYAR